MTPTPTDLSPQYANRCRGIVRCRWRRVGVRRREPMATSRSPSPSRANLRISAPHCSICSRQADRPASRLLTIRAILPLFVVSANRMKLGTGSDSWLQEMSRTAFGGDRLTHGGQKGFGMTKHGRSGHATRSPRFRFLQKLEAQKNDRRDRSRIEDPKQSVEELFHPRKPTRT